MSPLNRVRIAAAVSCFGFAVATVSALPAPALACRPSVPESAYSMEVLVDGRPLTAYAANGASYVEALKGREYSVRLTNRTGERVAVALAVDGLNSIDAKHTSSRDARKWILAPWETVTLSGWQTGSATARRFVFTSESNSYGAWLGRTGDLGVISAAFFREAQPPRPIAPAPSAAEPFAMQRSDDAPSAGASSNDARREKSSKAKDELAATGIGREIEHRVVLVDFESEQAPASTISVRYEYHDALVKLGVLPAGDDALARRERARGFAEPGFAPDPFRR
jgi:hypothetical protein